MFITEKQIVHKSLSLSLSLSLSFSLSLSLTFPPCSNSTLEKAFPNPWADPVIIATFPENMFFCVCYLVCSLTVPTNTDS